MTTTLTATSLHTIVESAIRAPSLQNSQPWRFRRHPDGIGFPTARRLAAEVIDP